MNSQYPPPPPTPYEVWFLKSYRFGPIHKALHTLLAEAFEAGRRYEREKTNANPQESTPC